ncbi:MAG: hypothetical protein QXL94_07320 [Candidatus Parvarchaeum sp.]
MKTEDFITLLQNNKLAVFTLKDLEKITDKGPNYAAIYAKRMLQKGKITKIERGKYCLPTADIYEISSNIIFPAYISMFSAFSFYGLTTQQVFAVDVISMKRHKEININGFLIRFRKIKREGFFGFKTIKDKNIMIAGPEKAIIDAIYFKSPNMSYIEEAFQNGLVKNMIKKEKLIEYAKEIGSKITYKTALNLLKKFEVENDVLAR